MLVAQLEILSDVFTEAPALAVLFGLSRMDQDGFDVIQHF
jgi:hypothetical protein